MDEFKLDNNTAETGPEETMDPIKETSLVAKRFGLLALVEKLHQYKVEDGIIVNISKGSKTQRVPVKWDRTSFSQFHDVRLKSMDGTIFPAHKCILIARLEYFNIMFLRGWREASCQEALAFPLERGVLELLLEFLYTDKISSLINHGRIERADLAWGLLIAADEFLMPRLKALSEQAIKELLTIQNVVQFVKAANIYNAERLRQSCLEFISFNIANLLELRSLEALSEDLLLSLSKCYQKTMKLMTFRVLTPHTEAPRLFEIQYAAKVQPPPWVSPEEFEDISIDSAEYKKKPSSARKRTRIRKSSESGTGKSLNESNCSVEFSDSLDKSLDELTLGKETEDVILNFIGPEERVVNLDVSVGKENQNPVADTTNPLVKASVPLPNPLFMQKFHSNGSINEKNCDYPELGHGDTQHRHNRQRTKSEKSTLHRLPRLSQKQRKRLLSLGENPNPMEEAKQSHCPWEKLSQNNEEKEVSLKDIMEREALEARKTWKVTPAFAITSSKKAAGSQASHSWSHVTSTGSSPSSIGQSFPVLGFASNSEGNLSLDEIIAEEHKRKENFFRMKNKPLHLTQLEDKAMDDLMKFYNAHNSHFECITVKRVEYTLMAQPKWIARPLLNLDNTK